MSLNRFSYFSIVALSLSLSFYRHIYIYFIESHHPSLCGSSSVKILLYKELKKDNLFECKWIQMNLFSFPPLPSPSLSPVVSKLSLLKHKESRSFYMFPSLHSFVIARKKSPDSDPTIIFLLRVVFHNSLRLKIFSFLFSKLTGCQVSFWSDNENHLHGSNSLIDKMYYEQC